MTTNPDNAALLAELRHTLQLVGQPHYSLLHRCLEALTQAPATGDDAAKKLDNLVRKILVAKRTTEGGKSFQLHIDALANIGFLAEEARAVIAELGLGEKK